jgi:hypothetical protein
MRAFQKQDASSSPETSFVGRLFEKAKNIPNTVPKEIRQELAALSAEVNGGNEELKKVPKEEKTFHTTPNFSWHILCDRKKID